MRLVYLYVEMPGSVLSEKGMNFSSSYVIYLAQNPEEYLEKANYILELRSKESYDDILYGKNIEVCGIVGNNGTGKSTALDYIRRMHYNSMDFIWETKVAFSIWEENGEFYLCNSNSQMEKVSIHLYDYRSKNRIPFIREERVKSITGIIYYSDIVDEKYVYNTFDSNCINDSIFRRQRNISTSY